MYQMQQNDNVRYWDKYQKFLMMIRCTVIVIEILLIVYRLYTLKVPSFISLLQFMMIMLLVFMNTKNQSLKGAKLYILLNFIVIVFQFLNFLESFQTDFERNIYQEDFSQNFKKVAYPAQICLRHFFILFGWRIYEFLKLRELHPEQFSGEFTNSYYTEHQDHESSSDRSAH